MTKKVILVLNAGSSSLKFGVFELQGDAVNKILAGQASNLRSEKSFFEISAPNQGKLKETSFSSTQDVYEYSLRLILNEIKAAIPGLEIIATAHRVVHGGDEFKETVRINEASLESMKKYIPLAALHQPFNLRIAELLYKEHPGIKHFACFDTAFHQTVDPIKRAYAIPLRFIERGIKRYGFHGLSYQYITSILADYVGENEANKKWVIAHLGSGSSLCATNHKKSIATTMGFSVLDGLPMSTRPGELDPAIITYIQEHEKLDLASLNNLLYKESGLLGLSGGISSDVKALAESENPNAKFAIEVFAYLVSINIGKMAAAAQGIDGLIFTAGIGENSSMLRELICQKLAWMGVDIDNQKNKNKEIRINKDSSLPVLVLPTNEEYFMACEAVKHL